MNRSLYKGESEAQDRIDGGSAGSILRHDAGAALGCGRRLAGEQGVDMARGSARSEGRLRGPSIYP